MRRRSLALAPLLLAACSGSSAPDARLDRGADSRAAVDARRERKPDAGPDANLDGGYDVSIVADFGGGDARPTPATALYATTPDPSSFGLRTVSTSKPGSPSLLPSWSGYLDVQPLSPAGLQEQVPVSAGRPQLMSNQPAAFRGIKLPGGASLYHVRRKLLGTSALLLVGADGSVSTLREANGLYADTIGTRVALSPGGQLGAGVVGPAGVFLFHTDGTPFAGGTAVWKDIAADPGAVAVVKPGSLTLAGSWLYAVATGTTGGDVLLRAPADGSAALSGVTLPPSAGQPPVSIDEQLVAAADGKSLVLAAGSSLAARDLYVVDVQGGTARNLTQSPASLAGRGDVFGSQAAQLALSPAGTLVAYLETAGSSIELFVARTDGSGAPQQVSSDARFQPDVTAFANLYFADEQDLVFMAGISSTQQDIYRWDHAASQVSMLTGTKTSPLEGKGVYAAEAGWVAPSGNWLYLVLYHGLPQTADIFGVSLKTFSVVKVTSGLQVQATAGSFAACPSSGQLLFVARPNPTLYSSEVWSFDQEAPQPAQKRTAVSGTGYWENSDLLLSSDCSELVWSGGGGSDMRELWLLPATGGGVRKLTPAPMYIGSSKAFSPDQATIIYASGGSATASTIKAVPVAPGPPVTLDTAAGSVHVFAVY